MAKAGKYQESVYYYEKSIELDPTNDSALNNYAYVLKKLGRLEQSLELYNKSLRMASNSSVTLKNRALLYEELAAKEYGKYLELSPNAKDAESVKKAIEQIKRTS